MSQVAPSFQLASTCDSVCPGLYDVQPQRVHTSSFCSTFKGIEPKKYDRSYNVTYCSFKNWYLLGVETISSHDHKAESWYFLGVLFKISSLCGSNPLGSTPSGWGSQSATYHCLNSPLHYVRLPTLISDTAEGNDIHNQCPSPSRDQCAGQPLSNRSVPMWQIE